MEHNKLIKIYRSVTQGTLHTLALMFILGMIANLYIEIPEGTAASAAWSWVFSNSGVIVAHIVLGTLLVVIALASLVLAVMSKNRTAILASSFGAVFTLAAYYFGADFVTAGDSALSSLLMAFGFFGALASYGLGVYKVRG
jgi:hypothetical protein